MTQITITRIGNLLDQQFAGLINMDDWVGKDPEVIRTAFLSRALAALCIKANAHTDAVTAANAVTDEFGDNGLDAIYFDQNADILFFVQSKWSENGNKGIDGDASGKFTAGIRDIFSAKFDRFAGKVRAKESEVTAALYSSRPIKFVFITAHTGVQPIAPFVSRTIDDLVDDLNEPVPVASAKNYNQAGIYGLITSESDPPKINLQISLRDWGTMQKPFLAYYGRVHVKEISKWWEDHGNSLFRHNLRHFYSNSAVNDALHNTLQNAPENFWYFNNGVTLICDSLVKSPVGAPERLIGLFACNGASVVNGAQTVGTIGAARLAVDEVQDPEGANERESWVQVRIISLEKCPPELSRAITRAANLQNAVGNREFAGMDPVQHRLATEFSLDKRTYAYKQGEADPKGNEGCDIVEATQALACAHSISLAVQAKREIGALWANTTEAPYTELFNASLSSVKVWRLVLILRTVDDALHALRSAPVNRADLIAVHMNRAILHLVFRDPEMRPLLTDYASEDSAKSEAYKAAARAFYKVSEYLEEKHTLDYLASLSKNNSKCEAMIRYLLDPPASSKAVAEQENLF